MNSINKNSSQQIPNLQCLKIFSEGMILNNVLDAITVMPKFTELNLVDCSFDSNKMHEILNIFEKRSDNNPFLAARTIKTISPSLSLLTKLYLNYIESGMNDVVALIVSEIKSLTHLSIHSMYTVIKTFVQNVSKLPLIEDLGVGSIVMTMGDLKTLATIATLRTLGSVLLVRAILTLISLRLKNLHLMIM